MSYLGGSAADGLLSASVRKQIERLGGEVPDDFQPRDWSVKTIAGEHRVPAPVQALLAVRWPAHQGRCTDDEFRWEVHLPADGEVDRLVVEDTPRAWYAVGYDEGQWFLLVDLAEADCDDFLVYRIDHDGSDDASRMRCLSVLLDDLRVTADEIVIPPLLTAGGAVQGDGATADALVADADWLVNTDPLTVRPLLDKVTTAQGRSIAAVYRASAGRHSKADPATRRQLLALDAARMGLRDLSRRLAAAAVLDAAPLDWTIDWATGAECDTRLRSRIAVGGPQTVVELQGRPMAVTLDYWTLHVHDLDTGTRLVEAKVDCNQEYKAIAVAEVDGRWVAVTGSGCPGCDSCDTCQGQLRVWKLADGSPVTDPIAAHARSVDAIAVTEVAGRPVILSGGHDNLLRMWDLRTGEPIGSPVAGHRQLTDISTGIAAIAVGELDGRPVAVTGGRDGAARVWDLADGATPGRVLLTNPDYANEETWILAVALGDLDGTPIAVTCGDSDIHVWDLRSGEQIGPTVSGYWRGLDLVTFDGRPTMVLVDNHNDVSMRDLRTREQIGSPFRASQRVVEEFATVELAGQLVAVVPDYEATTIVALHSGAADPERAGHTKVIKALAVTESDGPPVAVTGADDGTARVWNVDDGTPVCPPLTGSGVTSVATGQFGGRPAVLTTDGKIIRVWDRPTGELWRTIPTHKAADGHQTLSLAAAYLDGRPAAVTGGSDRRVLTWDLEGMARASNPPLTLDDRYGDPLVTVELDGRNLVLVKDGNVVRVADLASGAQLSTLEHDHGVGTFAVTMSQGRVIAVTSTDRELRVWDAATGERTGTLDTEGAAGALALADIDGHLVVAYAGDDRTVLMWDVTEDCPYRAPFTFPSKVTHLAVTGRGRLVITFGSDLAVLSPRA